jgi:hypothetical protein
MHKRRVDMLLALLNQLSLQHYLLVGISGWKKPTTTTKNYDQIFSGCGL